MEFLQWFQKHRPEKHQRTGVLSISHTMTIYLTQVCYLACYCFGWHGCIYVSYKGRGGGDGLEKMTSHSLLGDDLRATVGFQEIYIVAGLTVTSIYVTLIHLYTYLLYLAE